MITFSLPVNFVAVDYIGFIFTISVGYCVPKINKNRFVFDCIIQEIIGWRFWITVYIASVEQLRSVMFSLSYYQLLLQTCIEFFLKHIVNRQSYTEKCPVTVFLTQRMYSVIYFQLFMNRHIATVYSDI